MIIFDLDGTLADCEHRRHLVDAHKHPDYESILDAWDDDKSGFYYLNKKTGEKWKPDYKAFNEACDGDEPIEPVVQMFRYQMRWYSNPGQKINWQIWSGRCESVRSKTEYWLNAHVTPMEWNDSRLKMRPIGDSTPDDMLKERWLDEHIEMISGKRHCTNLECNHYKCAEPIDFVFDDRPKVIRMWRRRGFFVFNCCQHDEEF